MKIPKTNLNFVHFKSGEYSQKGNDVVVRGYIRQHIERNFDATYEYKNSIGTLSVEQIKSIFMHFKEDQQEKQTSEELKVNEIKLKAIDKNYIVAKRPNELYSGPRLSDIHSGLEMAKEAGIKSILALEGRNNDEYGIKAKEAGLDFIGLRDLGNKKLFVFGIIHSETKAKILQYLLDNPNAWVSENIDGTKKEIVDYTVADVQRFIDILNGKDEEFKPPVYFGCAMGTNRTYAWYEFYKILKNADRTKPLNSEIIEKLMKLDSDLYDLYRP